MTDAGIPDLDPRLLSDCLQICFEFRDGEIPFVGGRLFASTEWDPTLVYLSAALRACLVCSTGA